MRYLQDRGLSSQEPRHTLTDTGPASEYGLQASFVSHQLPILVKEHDTFRRHQLLESPAASKPSASGELGDTLRRIVM